MQETAKAHAAYLAYCELGPGRSLARLAAQIGESSAKVRSLKRLYERWSADHGWQERVKQYDREVAEERRRRHDADIEAMNERHVALSMAAQERATKQIEALIAAKSFGSQATVQLLKLAIDTERLARGAPTERSELTGKDGAPLVDQPAQAQIVIYIPDNGRDHYADEPDKEQS